MSVNYIHSKEIHNTAAAEEVLPYLFTLINPRSVADIGTGTGSWLAVAKSCGATTILGVDGIKVESSMLCIPENTFVQADLTGPVCFSQTYDLAICLEVAEHLPAAAADQLVSTLASCSDILLFSAAIPGQGGQAHLNEQWPEYWQEKFRKHQLYPVDILRERFWDNPRVDWWYKQNMLLYMTKERAATLGLKVVERLPHYIHPELLALKLHILEETQQAYEKLEEIINREINHPRFLPSLKRLFKSLVS